MNLSLPFALLTLASTSFVSGAPDASKALQLPQATTPSTATTFDTTDHDCLRPGQQVTYTVTLRADASTLITVEGDGRSDLDLFVYDENGNLVDHDNDSTDTCIAEVTPRWTGTFRIVVQNVGERSDCYKLTLQ